MKIALIFPGYGSQAVGMGKEIYDESRIVQEYFEEAAQCLDKNFVKLCFASSDVDLARTEHAYTSLFLVSCALGALLREEGIVPDVVAGYNFGELAAIHTARGISFPDGLYLLSKFAIFYQELLDAQQYSGVRISGLPSHEVQALCVQANDDDNYALIASYETPRECVVMGNLKPIQHIWDLVGVRDGVTLDEVSAEFGLHSRLMEPVITQLKMYLEKVDFKTIEMPLIANVDARMVTEGGQLKSSVIGQLQSPIQWHNVLAELRDCECIITVDPSNFISKMVHKMYPEKALFNINTMADVKTVKEYLQSSGNKEESTDVSI